MVVNIQGEEKAKRKQGGIRTIPFILANEVCDRFAAAGFHANMITYLTQQMHMPLVLASNTLTNFGGTASLTPIIGGLIADSFAGRFWTITTGSLIYQLGLLSITLSAVLPGLRPPPCNAGEVCVRSSALQKMVLYASLACTSIGIGGIRPCVIAFGADQLDVHSSRATGMSRSFFNLYFFSMELALILALTVVVYIQDNVGWGWGLGIPTIAMFISVVVFMLGYPIYIKLKPGGSPLTRLAQVVVAAIKKRSVTRPADPGLLYEDKELDAGISMTGRLLHTNQLVFLDRAAIVADGDILEPGRPRLWQVSTVHRVEELKCIIRMAPLWAAGILPTAASSHNTTFAIQQSRSMDRHITPDGLKIPPATMAIFTAGAMLLGLAFYDRVVVPVARRLTGRPSGITYLQRMGIGLAIAVFSTFAAALVEIKRKSVAAEHGLLDKPETVVPISVFWLVPQYAIVGVAESFMLVGHMEFLYDQAPESMRSTATALFWLARSIGSYMGSFLVTVVSEYTRKKGEWLQDNINRGKLDCYYWMVTGLQVLNLVYYLVCARFYTFKPLEMAGDPESLGNVSDNNGDVQLAATEDKFNARSLQEQDGNSLEQV